MRTPFLLSLISLIHYSWADHSSKELNDNSVPFLINQNNLLDVEDCFVLILYSIEENYEITTITGTPSSRQSSKYKE